MPKMTQHLAEVEVVDNIVSLDSSLIININYHVVFIVQECF